MKIFSNKKLSPEQEVNTLGNYLYKNIDSSFKFEKRASKFDLWITVLYEVPKSIIEKYDLDESYDELNEMVLNLSLTTYRHHSDSTIPKIRINIIEESPDELTIGSKTYDLTRFNDYYELRDNLMNYIIVRLSKKYEGYDFIF